MDSIIRDIRICTIYVVNAVKSPTCMVPPMIRFPPYHTTAMVVTFIANVITGIVAMTSFMARRLLACRSVLARSNFSISCSSRTKDFTTRTLTRASWMPEFKASSFFCITVNRG